MALISACLLYSRETTCKWNSCAISTTKDAKKIARIIRLLDWLNTGIDQGKEIYTVRNFNQSYNAKIFLRYLKKIYEDFTQYLFCTAFFLGIEVPWKR